MRLHKLSVELRYQGSGKPFDWKSDLIRAIAGTTKKDHTIDKPAHIHVDIDKKGANILIEDDRWSLALNRIENADASQEFAVEIFNRIQEAIEWKKMTRMGIRTLWLDPVETSFPDLVEKIKLRHFIKGSLAQSAEDLSLAFSLRSGDNKINFLAGPVTDQEVISRYGVDPLDLSPVMFAVDIDYYSKDKIESEKNFFSEFMKKAISNGESQANDALNFLS
jgi:hypothetical protein